MGVGLRFAWIALLVPALAPDALACEPFRSAAPIGALSGLTVEGDILLANGERARLIGLRFTAHGEEALQSTANLMADWHGAEALAEGGAADRWGRRAARIKGAHGDLAQKLVENGLALAWPMELPPNCRILFLEAENKARQAGRGIWSDRRRGLLAAAEGAAVAARAGDIAVMQGRIQHVGQTRRAVYLNFGARGAGASAELTLGAWRDLERAGWTREGLKGREARVRGVVGEANPARIAVSDAAAIEIMK